MPLPINSSFAPIKSSFARAQHALLPFLSSLLLLWSANSAAANQQALDIDICNVNHFQTLIQPAASNQSASAIWLDRALVQWPKVTNTGRFRLYHSVNGQIIAVNGTRVMGADGALTLTPVDTDTNPLPAALLTRFKYLPAGVVLSLGNADLNKIASLHQGQLVLVQEDKDGQVIAATGIQAAGALDDLYAAAAGVKDFGVTINKLNTQFKLWAPTAQHVAVCIYATGSSQATTVDAMQWDAQTGIWSLNKTVDLSGQYYQYVVDVFVRGVGIVRNRVTDPYSVSLTTNSKRSFIIDLNAPDLTPAGWEKTAPPKVIESATDLNIYELHVRDFSINDASVKREYRGKYLAFTEPNSNGIKHLRALAKAGMTDVHLLPIYDISTVPEEKCVTPIIVGGPVSEAQQEVIGVVAQNDCFNWGYDPYHYNSPEGSYASNAADGAKRIREVREMVMALHNLGLRVGMDVVYNHTFGIGQSEYSVLDRVVPGYYHRYNLVGDVERSTCCENTATENLMMGKLMIDSTLLWATAYKIDSFRFDLMGHQPLAVMKELQTAVNTATGKNIHLIGEGWDFGEVAGGARFVQASQLHLGGSGIGSFSDRARDAIRGQSMSTSGQQFITQRGYINGLAYEGQSNTQLLKAADMVRVGLAGTVRDYSFITADNTPKTLEKIDYNGMPAGYAKQPGEVVNYVENHDNQTLFDVNAYILLGNTSREDRARVQALGLATTAFSQGVSYYHAGVEILRSKSMDRDSFNSGDWFNRLDWTYTDNYFGTGMPPKWRNAAYYPALPQFLVNPNIKPTQKEILLTRNIFLDLLSIRASSSLFRLKTTAEIQQRLHFYNTGAAQNGAVIVGKLDGKGYDGANYKSLIYFINVAKEAQTLTIPEEKAHSYALHPVHLNKNAGDPRPAAQAKYNATEGKFVIPALTALVFVEQ